MSVSIGNELKDGYGETYNWTYHNVKWLSEVQNFYRARSALEREYSEKLNLLSTEYMQKKADNSVYLSVGEKPITTPGSLEAASVVAWNEILSQTQLISKDHMQFSQELEKHIIQPLDVLHKRCDVLLQNIDGFANEMRDRKENIFNHVNKLKSKYDDSTKDMESVRVKFQSNSSSDKGQKKIQEKEHIMNNAKNDYLLHINYANRMKDTYFFQDLPEVLDLLQNTIQYKTISLNKIYKNAGVLERSLGKRVAEKLDVTDQVVDKNEPSLDIHMFIKHNKKPWAEPHDFQYVPSPVWHEEGILTIKGNDDLHYMKVKLANSENKSSSLSPMISNELQELSSLRGKLSKISNTSNSDNLLADMKSYIKVLSSFTRHETEKLENSVVIESIKNNLSDYDLNTDNIDTSVKKTGGLFSKLKIGRNKSKSRNIPVSGVSNSSGNFDNDNNEQGSVYSHSSSDIYTNRTRSSTMASGVSSSQFTSTSEVDDGVCKVLYPYTKTDSDEVSVDVGEPITLVAADNGGWTRIKKSNGEIGLVPSTYVKVSASKRSSNAVPPPPRSRNTNTKTSSMTALYDYEAQGSDEISIAAGDVIKVVQKDSGNGWTLGDLNGTVGLFPTAYCK